PTSDLVRTDADGGFVLRRLRAVDGCVRAFLPGDEGWSQYVEATVAAAETQVELRVAADRVGSIAGCLRDGDGLPLAGVVPILRREEREVCRGEPTAPGGAFRFESVAPGDRYRIAIDAPGIGPGSSAGSVAAGGRRAALGVLAGPPRARLRIEFVRPDGSPWQGALPEVGLSDAAHDRVRDARIAVVDGGWEYELEP